MAAAGEARATDLKTLLVITYHFPPSAASGSFRMLGFARHLPALGWRTVVVAPPRMPWEPEDRSLRDQVPADSVLYEAPYPTGLLSKPARRLAPYGVWLPRALAAGLKAARRHRPDAVLTSGPPHLVHLAGLGFRRGLGLPWVADFRDPWVAAGGVNAGQKERYRWQSRMEKAVMRGADVVVANAPRALEQIRRSYPGLAGKMTVLTNGFDPERFPAAPPGRPPGGALEVLHAGELYAGRDPRPLLDAVKALPSEHGRACRVRFLGQSAGSSGLVEEARLRALGSAVEVGGQVPYDDALREMAAADVLLLLDGPGRRVGVPAKVYEYLGAGRPILALAEPDGDLAWVLRESGVRHRIAPPKDAAAIGRALAELADARDDDAAGDPPAEGRLRFTRAEVAGRLAAILDRLARREDPLPAAAGPPGGGVVRQAVLN